MLKQLKVFLRGVKRSRISFIINFIGLSSGLACTFLIYLWVRDEMSVDKFHKKSDQLYQVLISEKLDNGSTITSAITPGILADELSKNIPEIKDAVSVLNSIKMNTLSKEEKAFKVKGVYSGKDLFKIFTFNLIEGNNESALSDKSNIVISEELALKLFGTTKNVIGRYVDFDKKEQFLVSGIFGTLPSNSSIQFDFVLSLDVFQRHTEFEVSWNESMANTYLLLNTNTNIAQLENKMQNVLKIHGEDTSKRRLFARQFSDGYLYGNYENGVQSGGRIDYVKLFSITAIITLLIACINFISLSTAMATTRMKEVGMKKVLGSNRISIILQHLGESVILAFFSLIVALLLVFLLLPSFNELAGKQIEISLSFDMVLSFLSITLITGILAGVYPAFYISGFEPKMILKQTSSDFLGGQWIRKGLVVTQFTVSVILIIITLVVYHQFLMIQNRNLGYNTDGIIYMDMDGKTITQRETFIAELEKIPGVQQASSIYTLTTNSVFFGSDGSTGHMIWPGKMPEESISMNYRIVDFDLIELLNMEMKEGRSFSKKFGSTTPEIIFNETAIKAMGLKGNPIGTNVEIWNTSRKIIGVVKDFYFESIHAGNVKPMFIIRDPVVDDPGRFLNTIMVKIDPKGLERVLKDIDNFHSQFNPGYPFVYKFLDQDFQNMYSTEWRMSVLSRNFAGLAILISCLGLFGLTAFTVNRRRKEISTRKVLGASGLQIVLLLYKDVSKLVLVSLLVGLPIGYILSRNWLEGFAVRINLEPWFFVVAGGLSFALMLIASGIQVLKALSINPAESLRTE